MSILQLLETLQAAEVGRLVHRVEDLVPVDVKRDDAHARDDDDEQNAQPDDEPEGPFASPESRGGSPHRVLLLARPRAAR